ncbi:MAG: M12 family metallo-peptidase [Saprospiraceae bacterium]
MKQFLVLSLLLATFLSYSNAQQIQWVPDLAEASPINLPLSEYQVVSVDKGQLYTDLASAPSEFSRHKNRQPASVQLPTPAGVFVTFNAVESSVLHPNDQARWPQMRTYRIYQADNPAFSGRMSITPLGLMAAFTTEAGEVFIEPYSSIDSDHSIVYYGKDWVLTDELLPQLSCGYTPEEPALYTDKDPHGHTTYSTKTTTSTPAVIREYVMALTCTGEYANIKGGTVESVVASFVQAINLANTTFEREVGVRVRLIDNIELLVYLNAGTDPFINADQGGELLSQVRNAITGAGFPTTAYDLGHVFTGGCTDVGGVVGGNACTSGKDRGVTCHYTNNIASIIRRVFTHEVAHQFAVAHSWANCPSSLGQLASDSAFEPGSGTTIMSYAGSCGNQNVSFDNDDYYHGHSVVQFQEYTRENNAGVCATVIETGNTEPTLSLPYSDGFYIPIATPFELVANATDEEGDALTYCWEQMDLGPLSDLGAPVGNTPLFRSYPPRVAPNRVFPRLPILLNNQSETTEVLPTYSRNLTFRCTVRDNNPEIGATVHADVAFKSTATAGPFVVLSPNTEDVTWTAGSYQEVTWDVANTDNDLVNCQLVNIRLSADGGQTYPYTLISGTPNSGSAFVHLPEVAGNSMRIRVEAANNVFFDISNDNFSIVPATEPGFTMQYEPVFQQLCLPDAATVQFSSASILGFEQPLQLSISSELPAGVTAVFAENEIMPGASTSLTLDMNGLENYDGPLEVTVAIAAEGQDVTYRTLYFDVVDNDFSELATVLPVEGDNSINLGTNFSWNTVPNALTYDWELSDNAAFATLLDSEYGLAETFVNPVVLQLANNTLFFWRIRASNECGATLDDTQCIPYGKCRL